MSSTVSIEMVGEAGIIQSKLRFILIGAMIISIFIFTLSFILGEGSYFGINSERIIYLRIFYAIFGPLCAFIIYIAFTLIFIEQILEEPKKREIVLFVLLGSIIGILFAIALENRSILTLVALVISGIELERVQFILVAVIAPLAEEFSKFAAIYLLSRAIIVNGEKERRLVSKPQSIIFLSIFSGAIFNVLETYLYTWYSGYVFQLGDNDQWFDVSRQILLRAFNPLHITTAMISGLGIVIAFWNTNQKYLDRQSMFPVLGSYSLAVVIHGIWNGNLVLANDSTNMVNLFGIEIPLLNMVLLVFCQVILIGSIIWISRIQVEFCRFCGEWHAPPYDEMTHQNNYFYSTAVMNAFANNSEMMKYACTFCGSRYLGQRCPNCNTTKAFVCSNCRYPYPVYENKCWKCNKQVETVYDRIMDFRSDLLSDLSTGFVLFFTTVYVIIVIQLVISLPTLLSDELSDFVLVSYLLYLIIGISMYSIYQWSKSPRNPIFGKVLARYILAIAVLQTGLLLFGLGLNITILFSSIFVAIIALLIFTLFLIWTKNIFDSGIMVVN